TSHWASKSASRASTAHAQSPRWPSVHAQRQKKPRPSSQRVCVIAMVKICFLMERLQTEDEEPPAQMTKLAVVEENDEDLYETNVIVKCWACEPERGRELPDAVADPNARP
ncbi:hypothetical protein C0993_008662, partial [Termitomyces sp. T159_Od127]